MLLELSVTKTMQKESTHLDLWFRNGGWSKFSQISELNLNKHKILGGDVEGIKRECASTGTASGVSGEADTGPRPSGERERGIKIREGRRFAGAHAGDKGVWR